MYTQITLIPHGANSVYFVMRNGTLCPYMITHFSLNLEQLYSAFIDDLLGKFRTRFVPSCRDFQRVVGRDLVFATFRTIVVLVGTWMANLGTHKRPYGDLFPIPEGDDLHPQHQDCLCALFRQWTVGTFR